MAWSTAEYNCKLQKIRALMEYRGIQKLLLTTGTNFFWLTGGRPYVNSAVEKACADILITAEKVCLIVNNIEAERLLDEEMQGLDIGAAVYNWYDDEGAQRIIGQMASGIQVVTDREIASELAVLRWELLPEEISRYKETGKSAGLVVERAAYAVEPGMTERQAADLIRSIALEYGICADVALVAADNRAFTRRHPLPTESRINRYVMLVLSGRKYGLYASATRLVNFGGANEELKRRHRAVAEVDAAYILSTIPGSTVGAVFQAGMRIYAKYGFPDEWQMHHQGGLAGYNSREFRGLPDSVFTIKPGQVYAWNPSIAGVKSEDTILVTDTTPEVLTKSNGFPCIAVEHNGITFERPDILER